MWTTISTDEFAKWFIDLDSHDQERVQRIVRRIEVVGPTLTRPHADTVKNPAYANMKELRIQNPLIRIFFAFDPNRVAVLLVGGDKQNATKFYDLMIARADALYAEHLRSLGDQ
jgi:hypothetical protein